MEIKDKTIISRSKQSFLDICDNYLAVGSNVHCTFQVEFDDYGWMRDYFISRGGELISFCNNDLSEKK